MATNPIGKHKTIIMPPTIASRMRSLHARVTLIAGELIKTEMISVNVLTRRRHDLEVLAHEFAQLDDELAILDAQSMEDA